MEKSKIEANTELRGSLALANMTMETFTQAGYVYFRGGAFTEPKKGDLKITNPFAHSDNMLPQNCFTCHAIGPFGLQPDGHMTSLLDVSHIFGGALEQKRNMDKIKKLQVK